MAVEWIPNKCVECTGCVGVCPVEALDYQNGRIVVDEVKCIDCNICVRFCPVSALEIPDKPKPLAEPKEKRVTF